MHQKLVTVTRTLTKMKMKKSTKSGLSRPGNRWRLQDAKARLSELVRQAQQRGPQRVTLHGRDAVVVVRADEFDRMRRPISGRDIVAALATSPLADVNFERMTIKSLCVQPVNATPLVVYRLAFGSPRSFADVD